MHGKTTIKMGDRIFTKKDAEKKSKTKFNV
jgi:hypothetical protein